MRKPITASTALLGAAILAASAANATGLSSLGTSARGPAPSEFIVKVHTRREVHDMLHGYGYDHVVYQSQYGGGYGKPNYRFRACQGRRAFVIDVDWYGQIISRERDGRCYDDGGYGDGYRSGRRDW